MAGTWSRIKVWSAAETLTASDLNAEHDNAITHSDPDSIGDESATTTEMQATADPYPADSESLATDLKGEILRLRYVLKEICGESQWYHAINGNIVFPASQSASGGANTLDDYEEGSHVATVVCATSGSYTLNSSNDTLAYTKIGRSVHLQGRLIITGESSPNGQLRVSLPFTTASLDETSDQAIANNLILVDHGDAGIENPLSDIQPSLAYFTLQNITDTGGIEIIDEARVDTGFDIYINLHFLTA